ncbi:hypothetical protein [Neorhizobium sp. P12A]|uniref:hypothetical protein n=1 Tax=Neorhizobium sp. P12A TaxID=2268027 RepID=UPI001FEF12D9|nr:hypothetical protein [Neorhizobium sp. P12A]
MRARKRVQAIRLLQFGAIWIFRAVFYLSSKIAAPPQLRSTTIIARKESLMSAISKRLRLQHLLCNRAGYLAAVLAFPAGDALAISRYNSGSMTCSAIQDTLARERAVIFRYPSRSGAQLYDRYVSNGSLCGTGTEARRSVIPSRDGGCAVISCQQSWGGSNR